MAFHAYASVRECSSCAKNRVKLRKYSKKLMLVYARAPLAFVALESLSDLVRTSWNNPYLLMSTDCFSKVTRTVPLRNISATTVAHAFLPH